MPIIKRCQLVERYKKSVLSFFPLKHVWMLTGTLLKSCRVAEQHLLKNWTSHLIWLTTTRGLVRLKERSCFKFKYVLCYGKENDYARVNSPCPPPYITDTVLPTLAPNVKRDLWNFPIRTGLSGFLLFWMLCLPSNETREILLWKVDEKSTSPNRHQLFDSSHMNCQIVDYLLIPNSWKLFAQATEWALFNMQHSYNNIYIWMEIEMQSKGIFGCFVIVCRWDWAWRHWWHSEGSGGQCGDEVACWPTGGHACFVSPRESCGMRQEWCLRLRCSSWAPHRWAHETLCCPPSRGGGVEGERRGHPCYQSPRVELGPTALGSARQAGGTRGQGHIKSIGCPPLSARGRGWSQRREAEGITTRRCGAG